VALMQKIWRQHQLPLPYRLQQPQSVVGGSAVSELSDQRLMDQFSGMMDMLRQRGGPASDLAAHFETMHAQGDFVNPFSVTKSEPVLMDFAKALPSNVAVPPDTAPPAAGSTLWLAGAAGAELPAKLGLKETVVFSQPTCVWAGGAVSRGNHRLQVAGPFTAKGKVRWRSFPGLTLCIRGPLALHGPLHAVVAPEGDAAGSTWLEEGVLRCTLAAAGVGEISSHVFCELHGMSAAEEVQRAEGEACALELAEGSFISIQEGGCVYVDGSSGLEPLADASGGSIEVVAGGRFELFGLARLELACPTALMPAPPRILAQVTAD